MSPCISRSRLALLGSAAVLAVVDASHAAIFTVGTPGCTHTFIQAAIDDAAGNGQADTVRITRSAAWTEQAVVVNTSEDLNIVGGFAGCTSTTSDGGKVMVSGAGGAGAPVLRITTTGQATVKLRLLQISGGDTPGDGTGGGILYFGSNTTLLELIETTVSSNSAAYGGGIYALGNGSRGHLTLSQDTLVSGNTARVSGGGIYLDNADLVMDAPGSALALNTAAAFGGGLRVLGPSEVHIGTGGFGNLGAIYGNTAARGGGIAVQSSETITNGDAGVELRSTDPARPVRLVANTASERGGALYLRADYDEFTFARVNGFGLNLEDNVAPDGAAIYADFDDSFDGGILGSSVTLLPAPCNAGTRCNRIAGNQARTLGGTATSGPIVLGANGSHINLRGTELVGNVGGPVLYEDNRDGELGDLEIHSVLIAGNNAQGAALIHLPNDGDFRMFDSTIADNSIGGTRVIASGNVAELDGSIVWQPGKTTITAPLLNVGRVLASEIASLGTPVLALQTEPRFIDPANGDYGLRAGSVAIDVLPPVAGDDRDLAGNARDQDIALAADVQGVRDLGALERPALQPLVLNGDFDIDLRIWSAVTGGVSQHQAEDREGTVGSGSLHVVENGGSVPTVTALRQCVNLPGPANYRLNGWGRSYSNAFLRDTLRLRWRFRRTSGDCSGAADREGDLELPNNNGWATAAAAASIAVPPSDWNDDATIEVLLIASDQVAIPPNDINVAFDDIVLSTGPADPQPDALFADGFE